MGRTINGKYKVLSILGEGGFGIVYKVELLLFDTGNKFALKLLHPALSQDSNFRRRFLREAGLAMALIHENTIQIREFGQTEDGHLFFTMDYCEGEPLKAVITRERFLTVNRALHITRQILSVMKLAHARGIIHRDLKPENIFLEKDASGCDFVKVGDFGLAKSFCGSDDGGPGRQGPRVGQQVSDITRGGVVGTPRYMSPEQSVCSDDLDDRSDVYSIGVVLYEMLYGNPPAERTSPDPLKTPVSSHPVPRSVWEIARKALEFRREDRFQSAAEFLEAIDLLPQYTPTYIEPRGKKRRVLTRWVPVAAALLLLGGVVWMVTSSSLPWSQPPAKVPSRPLNPNQKATVSADVLPSSAPLELEEAARVIRDVTGVRESTGLREIAGAGSISPAVALQGFPRAGIRSYVDFKKNEVLRYQSYREGMVPDREITFKVLDEPSPGVFTVRASPGDREFSWIVDEEANALYQEFQVLDPSTGALTAPIRRTCLKLPSSEDLLRGDFQPEGLRIHPEPVSLEVPRNSKYDVFNQCLLVESYEGNRIHHQYYQEGNGLVALVVEELRPPAQAEGTPKGDFGKGAPLAAGSKGVTSTTTSASPTELGSGDRVIVYARYFVDRKVNGQTP